MRIIIGGEAGQGIAAAAKILGRSFTQRGYYVFNYRDYPSLIRGGYNFNIVEIETKPVMSHDWEGGILLALHKKALSRHKQEYTIGAQGVGGDFEVPSKDIVKELNAPPIVENSVLLGALYRALNQPIEPLLEAIRKSLKPEVAEVNAEAARRGYDAYNGRTFELAPAAEETARPFITGNEAIGLGAIAAGLDLYIAYPMTPATPVMHFLAKREKKYDIRVLQLENEIAVVNAALGASYAGAIAMVGTSGGGLALMSEALSLQGMSEVPLVVYLSQRPGPSTGIPTYTSQGDLKFALNAGHGEFPRVVVAPGDAAEAFQRTAEAIYLAYKYRVLSIIIGDKHLGESHYTLEAVPELRVKPSRFLVEAGEDYKSYEITENGVTPRAAPGGRAIVKATSYEHDEWGITTEEPELATKMHEKRWRKFRALEKEVKELEPYRVYGNGRKLVVGWGSTKGAILDAISGMPDFAFLQISYISPFPREIRAILEAAEDVILVENNFTGLLGQVIAEQTGFFIEKKILKADGRPFGREELRKKLMEVVA